MALAGRRSSGAVWGLQVLGRAPHHHSLGLLPKSLPSILGCCLQTARAPAGAQKVDPEVIYIKLPLPVSGE